MNVHSYVFGQNESLWAVCGRYLSASGFPDVPTFRDAVVNLPQNSAIYDWLTVPAGTLVWIPFIG